MSSIRYVQRQIELQRLGNRLPVLGKAISLCEVCNIIVIVTTRDINDSETVRLPCDRAMSYLFVRFVCVLRGARDKEIPGYRSSGKIHVVSRRL